MKIRFKSGYKYQLDETAVLPTAIRPEKNISTRYISLDKNGTLTIRDGYSWDGCSGPTWDDKTNMRAGLVHDALYQLMRMDLLSTTYRHQADRELRRYCRLDGMGRMRAWYYYKAVRKFGLTSAVAENRKKIHEAP